MTQTIILAVLALVIGILFGVLVGKRKNQQDAKELLMYKTKMETIEQSQRETEAKNQKQIDEIKSFANMQIENAKQDAQRQLDAQKSDYEKRLNEAKEEKANALAEKEKQMTAQLSDLDNRHKEAMSEQEKRFNVTLEKVKEQMKVATDTMLKERQKEFTESSSSNLGQIVNPLKDTIKEMKEEMAKSTKSQTEINSEMRTNMEHIIRQSQAAQQSAEELTRAFKHKSKVQGDWGEIVLSELLTSQGLTEGVHYHVQAILRDEDGTTIKPDEGSNLRPDVVLHLDEKRDVIIDSKVSLKDYIDYVNSDNEQDRQICLNNHIASLKKHVDELSKKDYPSFASSSVEFVIMFVPHTAALLAATNQDHSLWRNAMEKKVFIADEQTLFAALKIIRLTWTQIEQEQNHQKLYDLASIMLDRVGLFLQHYDEIGKWLDKASSSYAEGSKQLADSGQSITVAANNMIKLGVKNKKAKNKLPKKYMNDDSLLDTLEENEE